MYFIYSSTVFWEIVDIYTVLLFEIASAHTRKYVDRPPSCLTHESSSLCSFQRSKGRLRGEPDRIYDECESSLEDVPSKLSSTADSINRVRLDLYRDEVLFRERCAQTNRETTRANFLSLTLAITGRQTPGIYWHRLWST